MLSHSDYGSIEIPATNEEDSGLYWKVKLLGNGVAYLFFTSLPGHFTYVIHNDFESQASLWQKYGLTSLVFTPLCASFVACVPNPWKPIVATNLLLALATPLMDEGVKWIGGTGMPYWAAPLIVDAVALTVTCAPAAVHGVKKLVAYCRNNPFTLWQREPDNQVPASVVISEPLPKPSSPNL